MECHFRGFKHASVLFNHFTVKLSVTSLSELLSHLRLVHSGLGAGQLDLKTQMKAGERERGRERDTDKVKLTLIIHYEQNNIN